MTKIKGNLIIILILILPINLVYGSELGNNLIKNPSFEDGWSYDSPKNWTTFNNEWNGSLDESSKYNGKYSYKSTTESNYGWGGIVSSEIIPEKNKIYLVRTHMKYENTLASYIRIEILDSDNTWEEFGQVPCCGDGVSNWQEYYTFVRIPNDTQKIRIVLNAGRVKNRNVDTSTWFDDIEFIDPLVINPSRYISELSLNIDESWQINNDFSLFLNSVSDKSATLVLSYKGYPIINKTANKGEYATLEYNKKNLLIFKLDDIYNNKGFEKIFLKEILAGSIQSENIYAPELNVSISVTGYDNGKINLTVNIVNKGEKTFDDDVEIMAKFAEDSLATKAHISLNPGRDKNFSFMIPIPENPGKYKMTGILKNKYSIIKNDSDFVLKYINPPLTAISIYSINIKDKKGISGKIILGSPFADNIVTWNLPVNIDIYVFKENGKKLVYSEEMIATQKINDFFIPYGKFYRSDGRYVIIINSEDMKDSEYLEIFNGYNYKYGEYDNIIDEKYTKIQALIITNLIVILINILLIMSMIVRYLNKNVFNNLRKMKGKK